MKESLIRLSNLLYRAKTQSNNTKLHIIKVNNFISERRKYDNSVSQFRERCTGETPNDSKRNCSKQS